jgi:hypothetical protein
MLATLPARRPRGIRTVALPRCSWRGRHLDEVSLLRCSILAKCSTILSRRGRRQYLHPARWEEVRKTWLNHNIPTAVARKLESTVDSGGWETL